MIEEEAIEEFKQIYKEEFGQELSDKKAIEKGLRVLELFRVIYRPIKAAHPDEKEYPTNTVYDKTNTVSNKDNRVSIGYE